MTDKCPHCGFLLDEDCDDEPLCSDCGAELQGFSEEDDEEGLCIECTAARDATAALEAIEDGEMEMAQEILASHSLRKKNVVSDLIAEADYYARLGDADEAQFRLRCAAAPKFSSVEVCQQRYAAAMAEKHGVAA
ncbi:hypothetical protein [Pseudorhodoplanes sinuspersici]|uniref:Uncharacterized protein n=1 Tax=Pseudorhodoplanes sinuspersici TaxID=1235591 RepID=A0A1W6ZX65_9HYPH|nr:hypothetical protein [Pseudorhodoplanes sinuspersici]ARQ01903.1 hypothetical protein CAK95_24495 [Pseudorhodoplanes sinuspersici]RKE73670.1 hypothetical protein DFP91_1565 [Pseudorhodoplanes sinuspersici]